MGDHKRLTAYHEAGHAIVSYRLDPEAMIAKLSIQPKDGSRGRVSSEDLDLTLDKEGFQNQIICLMAGEIAEGMAGIDVPPLPKGTTTSDHVRLDELLEHLGDDSRRKALEDRAKSILVKNRAALDLVAEELLQHEVLDMEEFLFMMEIVDGVEGAREGLQNWRVFKAASNRIEE